MHERMLKEACDVIWKMIGDLDERIATDEPFKLIKEDKERGVEMIVSLVNELYTIGRMLNPIMPEANVTIKESVLANKKPENLFNRLEE